MIGGWRSRGSGGKKKMKDMVIRETIGLMERRRREKGNNLGGGGKYLSIPFHSFTSPPSDLQTCYRSRSHHPSKELNNTHNARQSQHRSPAHRIRSRSAEMHKLTWFWMDNRVFITLSYLSSSFSLKNSGQYPLALISRPLHSHIKTLHFS